MYLIKLILCLLHKVHCTLSKNYMHTDSVAVLLRCEYYYDYYVLNYISFNSTLACIK